MMRKILNVIVACAVVLSACKINRDIVKTAGDSKWKLVFEDDFQKDGRFDESKWSFSNRGGAAWSRYLTASHDYAYQKDGKLVLRMDNKKMDGDSVPYHSVGIQTKGKFNFLYGKVEVRAKYKEGRGAWPAIWMMPEKSHYGEWPKSGEIDIMEHINTENIFYQTVHNASVTNDKGGSSVSDTVSYKKNDFNVYGLVWTPDALQFYINGKLHLTYPKVANADWKSWPYDKNFYLILNQSGGLGWPGPITDADLPFNMEVDWVKVYQH